MQVLLKTDYKERRAFIDAAIGIDDVKALNEFERQKNTANKYILFGQKSRCDLYEYLLKQSNGDKIAITKIFDKDRKLGELIVRGDLPDCPALSPITERG